MTNSSKTCADEHVTNVSRCHKENVKEGKGKTRDDVEKNECMNKMKSNMYTAFQNWAIQNYGDRGKTKTVTRNKYKRIVRILTGEEEFTAENSKFRFWVKAKGFQLSAGDGEFGDNVLVVPSRVGSEELDQPATTFKQVAVVESFYDIIYNVHVEMDGRGGKHAGQKRTYRAIAETFSFLPREAVTRFLMSCTDCQKRMHVSAECNNNLSLTEDKNDATQDDSVLSEPIQETNNVPQATVPQLNEAVTQATSYDLSDHNESESGDSVMSIEESPSLREPMESADKEDREGYVLLKNNAACGYNNNNNTDLEKRTLPLSQFQQQLSPLTQLRSASQRSTPPVHVPNLLMTRRKKNCRKTQVEEVGNMTPVKRASTLTLDAENRAADSSPEVIISRKASPIPGKVAVSKGHPERKRRASSESGDSAMTKTSEGKDDDDDDDNDDDEKIPAGHDIDPERLKAFNMFVRLFVDENLDRMVPISKQPKDKIQAILEACDRQFPEFNERSRKRIRTYLKSCRRLRRSKEHNGWEPLRPTPPHLTSAAAENLLATACENESQNAKRMRLGLEPLPASAMVSLTALIASTPPPSTQPSVQPVVTQVPSQPNNMTSPRPVNCSISSDFLRHNPAPPPPFRPAQEFTPPFFTNGHAAALFRPGFPGYQHPAHHNPTIHPQAPITSNSASNGDYGPTDLSIKKSSTKGQLNPSEVTAIKQLIAGYRESAAFLYRSADELEQLLLQQN